MTKRSLMFSLLFATGLYASGLAAAVDAPSSLEIKKALSKAVGNGQTIEEAVSEGVKQNPAQGEDTVAAALSILERLPKRACAIRTSEGTIRLSGHVDYKACSERIVRAAIAAGADPSAVSKATAAGMPSPRAANLSTTSSTEEAPPAEVGPIELFLRKILLFQSMGSPD